MRCTEAVGPEKRRAVLRGLPALLVLPALLAGCGMRAPPRSAAPATPATPAPAPQPAAQQPAVPAASSLPATPAVLRSKADLQRAVARRLVLEHPESSYLERAPDRLFAIPVLEIELNVDGSVRRIEVLRRPSTGDRATQLAIAAVRKAAPYGDLSRVPRPWKVVETFLFNDRLHFKPRTLDAD